MHVFIENVISLVEVRIPSTSSYLYSYMWSKVLVVTGSHNLALCDFCPNVT